MNSVQGVLDSILFSEKFPPPNLAFNDTANTIHTTFWEDSYNRNLRLQDVEIEVRLGKCPPNGRGSFNTSIPERQFGIMIESLQGFNQWDHTEYTEDIIGYFPEVDESVRHVISSDGSQTTTSKQKVTQADYIGKDLPFDFRLAVNIELKIPHSSMYQLQTAKRIVNRKRHSFTLKNFRYDLTRIIDQSGAVTHQVEIELINLPDIQLRESNAQVVTQELQSKIIDIMNSLEPVRSFHIDLLRKRHF